MTQVTLCLMTLHFQQVFFSSSFCLFASCWLLCCSWEPAVQSELRLNCVTGSQDGACAASRTGNLAACGTSLHILFADADDSWMFDVSVPAYLLNASGGYWLAEVWGYHRQLSSGVPTFRIMLAVYHSGWYHVRKIISLTVVCVLINSPAVSLPRGRQKTL